MTLAGGPGCFATGVAERHEVSSEKRSQITPRTCTARPLWAWQAGAIRQRSGPSPDGRSSWCHGEAARL